MEQPCPAGSTSAAGSDSVHKCFCAYGRYVRQFAASDSGDRDPLAPAFECAECPEGALCLGDSPPLALADWWSAPGDRSVFYQCAAEMCLPETAASVAAGKSNCRDGHMGPVCGVCADGFTFQGDLCKPCDARDAFKSWSRAMQAGLITAASVVFLVASTAFLLSPLFVEQYEAVARTVTLGVRKTTRRLRGLGKRVSQAVATRVSRNTRGGAGGAADDDDTAADEEDEEDDYSRAAAADNEEKKRKQKVRLRAHTTPPVAAVRTSSTLTPSTHATAAPGCRNSCSRSRWRLPHGWARSSI